MSRARQELTGAALAPKTAGTLRELQEKRLVAQVREIPPAVLEYTPERPLDLDADLFGQCLSSAPSGTSPGPVGCTNEMLRVCLDDREVLQLLFRAAEDAARAEMPTISVQGVHVGDDDGSAELAVFQQEQVSKD